MIGTHLSLSYEQWQGDPQEPRGLPCSRGSPAEQICETTIGKVISKWHYGNGHTCVNVVQCEV